MSTALLVQVLAGAIVVGAIWLVVELILAEDFIADQPIQRPGGASSASGPGHEEEIS